jgi:hypothetical protein
MAKCRQGNPATGKALEQRQRATGNRQQGNLGRVGGCEASEATWSNYGSGAGACGWHPAGRSRRGTVVASCAAFSEAVALESVMPRTRDALLTVREAARTMYASYPCSSG